jgi:hypothetical protein
MVFLWNIFMNNNWLEMAYMAVMNFNEKYAIFGAYTKYYFVLFSLFTAFMVMNIITGKKSPYKFQRIHHRSHSVSLEQEVRALLQTL